MKNTLNVGRISEGFVLDHIEAGKVWIFTNIFTSINWTAVLRSSKNARSSKMGKKRHHERSSVRSIFMDLDILGFIDHNITVNIISNEQVVDKKNPKTSKRDHQCDPLQKIQDVSHPSNRNWITSLS